MRHQVIRVFIPYSFGILHLLYSSFYTFFTRENTPYVLLAHDPNQEVRLLVAPTLRWDDSLRANAHGILPQ